MDPTLVFTRTCGICNGRESNRYPCEFEFDSPPLCHLQDLESTFCSFIFCTGYSALSRGTSIPDRQTIQAALNHSYFGLMLHFQRLLPRSFEIFLLWNEWPSKPLEKIVPQFLDNLGFLVLYFFFLRRTPAIILSKL